MHTLFPNNARVNKTEKIQQLEGFLKQRMMEEANEEFKLEKSRTENANTPRKYRKKLEGKRIFSKCNAFYNGTSDIPRKRRRDKEFMSYINIHK